MHRNAFIVCLLLGTLPAAAQEPEAEVDRLGLATLLLKDGHAERAFRVLSEVDPTDKEQDKFHRLMGLVELKRGRFAEAGDAFGRSIKAGDDDARLHLLQGQAYLKANKLQKAVKVFESAPTLALKIPRFHLARAQALWQTGKKHEAFTALELGLELHSEDRAIERSRIFMLVELGLYQEGLVAARDFFERIQATENDHIALAEALRNAGQLQPAILFLEAAVLKFPQSQSLRTQLASTYLKAERPLASGEVIRPVAYEKPEVALAAAELYRRARRFLRALDMNARVVDQKEKIRQRLGLLIELGRFESAATLHARLSRLGLLKEENTAYALAYAHFKAGNYERVEQLLRTLKSPELFRKGVALRRSIQRCAEAVWQCE